MAQWGQGYQYPMQTGYNPQQFQQGFQPTGGIAPQPTGFPGQRPPGFQQPQPTGFPGASGFQQPQHTGYIQQQAPLLPQQTGFPGTSNFQQRAPPPPPPVPPIPSQFQQYAPPPPPPVPPIPSQFQQQNGQGSGFLGVGQQQPSRLMATSPLTAQPTGFPGMGGGLGGGMRSLVPQATGFVDPRLQMMSSTFLPANPSMPYNPTGAPQFQQQGGMSLQQSIQQHNQAQRGNATPKIPWALSKAEKKNYDQIFRAWDVQGTGFISGQTALEVFGQSGLDKNDLAKIWALADADNRGKLNLAEFHVAMGLIYRRLNGNDIPDELPPELVPPSHRDLDSSVDLLKDILKNDTRARSPSNFENPVSRLKERSFNSSSAPGAGGRQDATVYKYNDESPPGGFYQPRSRHVDRSAVRTTSELESPVSDLSDMKRQLENTARMLDRATEENASRTAEDEALEREMEDLRYRVKRVKEDLEYVSRGPRSHAKDEDRRKLERELLQLMHERIPEVERKIKDREERREREKREWARERDRRNERFGRYDDRDDRYSSRYDDDRDRSYRYDRDRDRDRDWDGDRSRDHDYDRDRPYSRARDRDYDRDRDRDRDYDRPRSPPAARSPPPAPPPAPSASAISKPPPPAPTPTKSPAPNIKNMTEEERKAFIHAEAQRRMQERMAALGVVSAPSPSPKLDTSVEDRLAQEKKEAEEKARVAEREAEKRERLRRERLEGEKALKEGRETPAPPTPAAPAHPSVSQVPTPKPTPPPPKPKAPAPPPPRKAPAPRPPVSRGAPSAPTLPVSTSVPAAPPPAPAPAMPEVDPEEEEIFRRQDALRKQRERLSRLRQLELAEEETRRAEEEYQARRRVAQSPPAAAVPPTPLVAPTAPPAPASPPPPPAAAPPPAGPEIASPPPPPPPPAPSSHASTPSVDKSATNPFSRLMKESPGAVGSPATPSANGSTNPFFKTQAASPSVAPPASLAPPLPAASIPPPSKSPAPPAVKTSYHTAPADDDDDWGDIQENDDNESSDDEIDSSRDTRNKLAQQLFGSILPPSRPQSAAAATSGASVSSPISPSGAPPPPPPPSAPPRAPAPVEIATLAPTGDRSALLDAIQSGARLRKTQTNDRSKAAISGKVLGDTEPPAHINAAPRAPSPPSPVAERPADPLADYPMLPTKAEERSSYRDSVAWYAGMAADGGAPKPEHLPSMQEEEEPPSTVPAIQVNNAEPDAMADVDKSTEYRVRSLYPYEGQRAEDLSFSENLIIIANPSKTGGDWWHGTSVSDGKTGFFPKTYVEIYEPVKANALYSYTGTSPEELPFSEGDELTIVDRSESDWWKAEQDGVVFIVPAAYLEVIEAIEPKKISPAIDRPEKSIDDHDSTPAVAMIAVTRKDEERDEDDSSEEDYMTSDSESDDTDDEQDEEARKTEKEARILERQRVLEAAGLIIKSDDKPPPRPARRKRRPPPAVPDRAADATHSPERELPNPPDSDENDHSLRLDDAYERYEAFRQTNADMNRLSMTSIASVESSVSMPGQQATQSASIARSPSAEPESRTTLHFFSRFGRKTPANEGESRVMPTISAPILSREPSSPTLGGFTEDGFGSSWASLVDKSALEEIPVKERRRQESIFEFIVTEAAYVRDLQLIVELFYGNLLPVLDEKAVKVIFANVEDILLTNTTFLSSLEQRQKECRLYIDKIGDILRRNMSDMGVYMEYCVNQGTAIKVLQSLRESNPDVAACLQRLREDPAARNLDLSSYLLVPMQRITRYPLLIRQVLHYTEMSDDRKHIEQALGLAERILEHINETIREQEGRERLRTISKDLWIGQGRLDLTAPTRYMGQRKLLKEGALMKAKSGRKLRAFLCSDILVLTEEHVKQLYRMPIPLSEVSVNEAPGHRDDLTFQVAIAYPRGGNSIVLRAASARDCQVWMQAIEKAGRICRESERQAR